MSKLHVPTVGVGVGIMDQLFLYPLLDPDI